MRESVKQPKPVTSKEVKDWDPNPSDSVFRAYVEGNARLPQTFRGIKVFVLAAALEEDTNWKELFTSRFSRDQVEHLLKLVERMHDKKNIKVPINEHRIQSIWRTARDVSRTVLQDCLMELDKDYNYILGDEDLAKYISDPKNKSVVKKLKESVCAVRDALRSPPASVLFNDWRNEFDFSKPENRSNDTGTWNKKGYQKKLSNMLRVYMEEHYPQIPEKLFLSMI